MKLARNAVMAMFLAATVAACDEVGDTTGPDVSALAGVYSVQTFEYVADDGSNSFDLATVPAQQGGPWGIVSMTVETDGSFDGVMKLPSGGTIVTFPVGGVIQITGANTMRIDFDAETDARGILDDFEDGTFSLNDNTLTLVLTDVTFDFTLSGAEPVPADLTIVATRS
ncbi:MAG: hypothetical protein KY466_11395 [Gemmatimonadetes bacterium]|nr:hypothetical protein [Gemmatimonadota bacterium]